MKKKISSIILIITLLIITGCTSTNSNLTDMENTYFDCIKKIYIKGALTPIDINEILDSKQLININDLKEYVYDGEFNSVYPTIVYRYSKKSEIFKAEYIKSTGNINTVSYENKSKDIKNKLIFLVNNNKNDDVLNASSDISLQIEFEFESLEAQLKINNLILNENNKKSDFYKTYLKLCKSIQDDTIITKYDIENMLSDVEVLVNKDTPFTIKSDEELLSIDNNILSYSNGKIILQYSSNNLNKIIINPDTLNEQKKLYELINENIVYK